MGEEAEELQARYRRCAKLRQRIQEAALHAVPRERVAALAEQLGLPVREDMAQVSEADLAFAFDLAIHTAAPGRPRPIERVGRSRRGGADEAALVLRGLDAAWFSVFRVLGPHPEAGLLLEDALLGGEVWVLDEALAESAAPGTVLATRLARVGGFAITSGVVATLDEASLEGFRQAVREAGAAAADMAADPRFALLIYRRAIGEAVGGSFGGG